MTRLILLLLAAVALAIVLRPRRVFVEATLAEPCGAVFPGRPRAICHLPTGHRHKHATANYAVVWAERDSDDGIQGWT